MRAFTLAAALLLASCAVEQVDRTRWSQMSVDDRTLYVQTLIAEEQAKDAKGGVGKSTPRTPQEYVQAIDAAYARGEARAPKEVFAELVQ